MSVRYAFGANWAAFVDKHYSEERRKIAATDLLAFLGRADLRGLTFLDIGCGSGLHSLAAFDAGAAMIHSFDFDPRSVETTDRLRQLAGAPSHWTAERGDVLDDGYMKGLGGFDLVYSWGVLHHTGDLWTAIDRAAGHVAPGGWFFIALYSSNVARPSPEYWLEVKRRYNRAGPIGRRRMEAWYVLRFGLGRNPLRWPSRVRQAFFARRSRGMSFMTDVRDWLGGWPMEYADDDAVVAFLRDRFQFALTRIATGEACTQFLFQRPPLADR